MYRRAITRTATRIASTLILAGAVVAPWSALTAPALAASHPHGVRHAARCHHRHARHCSRTAPHPSHPHPTPSPSSSPPASAPAPNASAPCTNADLVPTSENVAVIEAATLCLINQQRALHGEHSLLDSAALDAAATGHSQDMIAADYFDHTSPTGGTPLDRIQATGYLPAADGYEIGENIALGGYALSTPAVIVSAWMNSPDHRANILNADFIDSGIGVVAQVPAMISPAQVGATYTQDFGVVQSPSGASS